MPNRFLDLAGGSAMIVSDLHGDRDAFDRCLAHFNRLDQRGQVQRLIFLGDLIHGYSTPDVDDSLNMVLSLMALRRRLGPDRVLMTLGNHEMVHLYGMRLSKGTTEFTPRFEHALGNQRKKILSFFDSLPFYIRTAAGVAMCHAGPALESIPSIDQLRHFDHQAVLHAADAALSRAGDLSLFYAQYKAAFGLSYDEMAYRFLAVEGPQDPRYPHLLRALMIQQQSETFQILWNTLFTLNEQGLNSQSYLRGCRQFLAALSTGAPVEQRVIVSGHIVPPLGGSQVVNPHHLRIASAAHARPREAGQYLLLDCGTPIHSANDLLDDLYDLFD